MGALITLGIITAVIAFILSLKATVTVAYDSEVCLYVRVLGVKIRILPKKEKKRKRSMSEKEAQRIKKKLEKKEQKKKDKKRKKQEAKLQKKKDLADGKLQKEKKTPEEILDIVTLVCSLVKEIVSKFFSHLRIKVSRIRLVIATGDAATTAITYGAVTQAINVLFPFLDEIKTLSLPKKERDVDISCDFTSEESEIDVCISFSLRVIHVLHVAFAALVELIKYFFKSLKRKE